MNFGAGYGTSAFPSAQDERHLVVEFIFDIFLGRCTPIYHAVFDIAARFSVRYTWLLEIISDHWPSIANSILRLWMARRPVWAREQVMGKTSTAFKLSHWLHRGLIMNDVIPVKFLLTFIKIVFSNYPRVDNCNLAHSFEEAIPIGLHDLIQAMPSSSMRYDVYLFKPCILNESIPDIEDV